MLPEPSQPMAGRRCSTVVPRMPENDIGSFMGQENWRQRIRRENLHAPRPRYVAPERRRLGVSEKPCHLRRAFVLSAEDARVAKSYVPQDQLLWPETAAQQVGWLAQDPKGMAFAERASFGPSKLGFGWRRPSAQVRHDFCVTPSTPSTASSRGYEIMEMPDTLPVSAAEQVLPWFPGIGKLRRQRRLWRKQQREERAQLQEPERPESAFSAMPGHSPGLRMVLGRSEDSWLGPDLALAKPSSADHGAITARSRLCREFLRHGPRSHWERQKPVSAMSSFAQGYSKLWGAGFFTSRQSNDAPRASMPAPGAD